MIIITVIIIVNIIVIILITMIKVVVIIIIIIITIIFWVIFYDYRIDGESGLLDIKIFRERFTVFNTVLYLKACDLIPAHFLHIWLILYTQCFQKV